MFRSMRYTCAYIREEGLIPSEPLRHAKWRWPDTTGRARLAVPSPGNAANTLTAYAAAAGIKAHIFVPRDVLFANYVEAVAYELMSLRMN
jgi:threonine synthase